METTFIISPYHWNNWPSSNCSHWYRYNSGWCRVGRRFNCQSEPLWMSASVPPLMKTLNSSGFCATMHVLFVWVLAWLISRSSKPPGPWPLWVKGIAAKCNLPPGAQTALSSALGLSHYSVTAHWRDSTEQKLTLTTDQGPDSLYDSVIRSKLQLPSHQWLKQPVPSFKAHASRLRETLQEMPPLLAWMFCSWVFVDLG